MNNDDLVNVTITMPKTQLIWKVHVFTGIIIILQLLVSESNQTCESHIVNVTDAEYNSIFDLTRTDVYSNLEGVYCIYMCTQKSQQIRLAVFSRLKRICSCLEEMIPYSTGGTIVVHVVDLNRRGNPHDFYELFCFICS